MSCRFIFLIILCLFSTFCFGEDLFLKEKLQQAAAGSYLVLHADKTYTFLHVYENSGDRLILEEVTIPAALKPNLSWREWFEQGALRHTSWTMTQLNLATGKIEEIYSFTRKGWLDTTEADHFIHTLLFLRFHEIPENYRRYISSSQGGARNLWAPPVIVDGARLQNIPFRAWKARWPNDRSELAKQILEVYLPEASEEELYPAFFPYWVEVHNKIARCRLRVVDGGLGVTSPMPHLPYRAVEFLESKLDKEGLKLKISSPSYYKEFLLIAEEDELFGKTFLLPCEISSTDKEKITLFVPLEALETQMSKGENYSFTISPKNHSMGSVKSHTPLAFN